MSDPSPGTSPVPRKPRATDWWPVVRSWIAPHRVDGPTLDSVPLLGAVLLMAGFTVINENVLRFAMPPGWARRLPAYATNYLLPVVLAVAASWMLVRRHHASIDLRPRRSDLRRWAPWALAAALLEGGVAHLGHFLLGGHAAKASIPSDVPRLAISLFSLLVAAPIVEEVVYRGILLPALVRVGLPPVPAIGITAVAWAAAHFGHSGGYGLVAVAGIAASGYVQGVIAFRTGRLAPAILIHATGNLLVVSLRFLGPVGTANITNLVLLVLVARLVLPSRSAKRSRAAGH